MSRRRTRSRQAAPSPTTLVVALIVLLLIGAAVWFFLLRGRGPGASTTPGAATAEPTSVVLGEPPTVAPAADWYQLYFTTPQYPDKPAYHHGSLDEHLVALIGTAKQTIDLADYDFDLENVATALAQAAGRGVRVRMVTDSDTINAAKNAPVQKALGILKRAKIPFIGDERGPIMHNKFLVVDDAVVWTGSWNFTDGDTYHLNNNGIIIRSSQLAQNYTAEFEKMFVKRLFGPNKPAGVPYPLVTIGATRIENYFAPEDKVGSKIVARLKTARQSIHFMAFSFTHDEIGQTVIGRAKAGVAVSGVFETTGSETKFSEYGAMKKAGLDVWQDGNPYVMHHKVFVIDGRTVVFGSFNFTSNADTDNDENALIVDDPAIAAAFEAEFQRVYAQAKSKKP